MNIQYLGHSSFLVTMGGKNLLLDPFISQNPKAHAISLDDIQADFILLSHGHFDHVADAEAIARKNDATIISNYEIYAWYESKGIKGHPMNIGGSWRFPFGTIKMVNAVHSSVLPDGTYGGNPGGFLITNEDESLYFAGDTALTMDMQLIKLFCPNLKVAILPVGDNFTMGVSDALIASDWIGCDQVVGCHFDTFGYIEIDHNSAQEVFHKNGKRLHLLHLNEIIQL
ncbi:MAG: metal-dependent hydrolase [Saprospiraceae bacterium]